MKILHTAKDIVSALVSRAISPITIWFGLQMQNNLELNRHKSGWEQMSNYEILNRIKDEVKELQEAIKKGDKVNIIHEAADVANFCSFIAHNNQSDLDQESDNELYPHSGERIIDNEYQRQQSNGRPSENGYKGFAFDIFAGQ